MTKAPPFPPFTAKASLDEVMAYRNDRVVQGIREHLIVDAELLFEDVKRFLYLTDMSLVPLSPPKLIDKGWHEFMLFSKDYREFCLKYFGRFIDHEPILREEKAATRPLPSVLVRAQELFGKRLSHYWEEKDGQCSADCRFGRPQN